MGLMAAMEKGNPAKTTKEDNEEGVAVRIWIMPGNTGLGLSHRTLLVFH